MDGADLWSAVTDRPDGMVRTTPGLIRIETGRDNVESVVWGKSCWDETDHYRSSC